MHTGAVRVIPLLLVTLSPVGSVPLLGATINRNDQVNEMKMTIKMIQIYQQALSSINETITAAASNMSTTYDIFQNITSTRAKENLKPTEKSTIRSIRWRPKNIRDDIVTDKTTTEIRMGAVIAVPPRSCPRGQRRQAGRCRKVYY